MEGVVYLIHFAEKIGNPENPRAMAQHYIGWCEDGDVARRLNEHLSGVGARIMAAVAASGIDVEVVRTWEGDRKLERQLKNRKNARKLCPTCQELH